jgi:TonB-linked SusC/RagA family outer membrane protein
MEKFREPRASISFSSREGFAFKKIIRMVRFTLFCFFLGLIQVTALNSYSQQTRISLNQHDQRLEDVLKTIEDKSEFFFLYNKDLINVDRTVTITAKDETINVILDELFKGTDIHYSVANRQIILSNLEGFLDAKAQQQKIVKGKVTDTSGNSLPGVSVVLKGTTTGTITDADGNYSLANVPVNAVLQFSFVGMKTQEIQGIDKNPVNVMLTEETVGIDEVVAIGYGTVKKQDLTGAVASVGGNVLAERQTVKVTQALQGAIPGLMVTRNSGAADAAATIRVRGVTTISDSNPLIIVDGIPGTLDWINPEDIESISVLKDAASASIYGSRAAAGVILVTTKRAKTGQLSLDYNYEYGIDKPTRLAEYADAQTYMRVANERSWNDAGNIAGNEYPIHSKDKIDNYAALHAENPDKYPITDWQDLILNDFSTRQNHKLTLTAGSKNIRTKVSMDYSQNGALYDGRNYDRMLFRANNDVTINKSLSVIVDINGIYSISNSPGQNFGADNFGNAPIYAAMWSDGRVAEGKSGVNPYAYAKYGGNSSTKANSLGGKIQLDFSPIDGLKLSGIFSPQIYSDKGKAFVTKLPYTSYSDPNFVAGYIVTKTSLNESRNDNYNLTTQFLANYVKTIGKHNLNIMGGYENYYSFNESLGASRDQFNLSTFPYLNLGNENYQYNNGSAFEYAYRSFFGRIMYNYNNRYFLQANSRYDSSSRFAKDYRWGLFPSFSTGWALSEEPFMKSINWLSFLKLRASWGTLGNERIGSNYPYQSTIGFNSALLYQGSNIVSAQTAAVAKYAIEDISWETTESYDFGLDANFLDNRLRFAGDYYKKTTKDMLLSLQIPVYIGLGNPNQNTGKMNTKGWEFELGWNDKVGDLTYSASFNLSDSKSVMGDLGGTEFLGSQVKFKGSEFNEWYGYKSDGLFQTQEEVNNSPKLNINVKPGDIKYIDISGPEGVPDGKISSEYDRVLLGGSLPRYQYGGNIRLGYKNFDFSMVFQGIGKQKSLMRQSMVLPFIYEYIEVPQLIVGKYWSKYNTEEQNLQAKYPRVSTVGNAVNYQASDYWLFNGAYFRLKNITLGYNLPKHIVEKCNLQGVRIYSSVSDLFSIDHYPKGWDPEVSDYWITTSYIFGIAVKF